MTRFGELLKGGVTKAPVEETPSQPEEKVELKDMSKLELESYGRTLGVELDRRQSKDKLINQLKNIT